jgi:leader peptidase (prepilin peptidase)/N-methyltransferase
MSVNGEMVVVGLFFLCLGVILVTDSRWGGYHIYRSVTYPGTVMGILSNGVTGRLRWTDIFLGMLILGLLAWLLRRAVSDWFGIGRGDIRLLVLVGAFLGWKLGLLALLLGCVIIVAARPFFSGPIVFERHVFRDGMPAGPALVLGAVISWILGRIGLTPM